MNIIGIDPGSDKSGLVFVTTNEKIIESVAGITIENNNAKDIVAYRDADVVVCEWMSYVRGGNETAKTLYWIGRFAEALIDRELVLYSRTDIKRKYGKKGDGMPKSADARIRAYLLKNVWNNPRSIRGHEWQALSVVAYHLGL